MAASTIRLGKHEVTSLLPAFGNGLTASFALPGVRFSYTALRVTSRSGRRGR